MEASRGIEAVVSDLDGTIVRADGTVSDATRAAVSALAARGIPFVAATARTPAGVRALEPVLAGISIAVCCSGAIGYRPRTASLLWRRRLSRATVAQFLDHVWRELPGTEVAAYDGGRWFVTEGYRQLRGSPLRGPATMVTRTDLLEVDACAMAACHPRLAPPVLVATLHATGLPPAAVTFGYAGRRVVEITPAGVDKASGVTRALRLLGVRPEQAVAFGDMPVDVPMFAVVGRSVAMADAPAEVREAATMTTPGVDDDGFAVGLRRLDIVGALRRAPRIDGGLSSAGPTQSAGLDRPPSIEGSDQMSPSPDA